MNPSLRTLCFPLVVVLIGVSLSIRPAAQHIPIRPQLKVYLGPGDTVPPCVPPACQPGPANCTVPCTSDYDDNFGCNTACYGGPLAWTSSASISFMENGQLITPECFLDAGSYRTYHVTVKNLIDAANAAPASIYPRSNLCFFDHCATGIDALFVYTNLPFQHHPQGIGNPSTGYLPVCGMTYGFKILRDNGVCDDLGESEPDSGLVNGTPYSLQCATNVSRMSLQFDVSCLTSILNFYAALGFYNADPAANTLYDQNTIVFDVIVKCCTGGPICE